MNLYDYRLPYHYPNPLLRGHKAKYKTVHRQKNEEKGLKNLHQIPILGVLRISGVSWLCWSPAGYAGHAVIKYLVAANFHLQHRTLVVRGEFLGPSECLLH